MLVAALCACSGALLCFIVCLLKVLHQMLESVYVWAVFHCLFVCLDTVSCFVYFSVSVGPGSCTPFMHFCSLLKVYFQQFLHGFLVCLFSVFHFLLVCQLTVLHYLNIHLLRELHCWLFILQQFWIA